MDLSLISDSELMNRLNKLVRTERKITHLILSHIIEVEERRLYAVQGYDSMFSYLTKCLGYGEDSAYRRLNSARILKKVPEVAEKIESGAITLTQLTQVQKCLKQEIKSGNQSSARDTLRVIEEIGNKSSFETQRILAVEFNQPIAQHEIIKAQRDASTRLEITFSEEQMAVLNKVKHLLSHSLPEGNWADLFVHLAEKQVAKIEGKIKIEKVVSKECDFDSAEVNTTQSFLAKRKRVPIKVSVRREVIARAESKCEYLGENSKCNSSFQLQIDHRLPVAFGGTNEVDNLRVLCRTHNLSEAKRMGLSR